MVGNTKVLNLWAPVVKEDAGADKRMGRVHSAAVIKEGFLEEAACKHTALRAAQRWLSQFKCLIYKKHSLPPSSYLTGLFKIFTMFEGQRWSS